MRSIVVFAVLVSGGCLEPETVAPPSTAEIVFHPRLPGSGKADGAGFLPEHEIEMLGTSLDGVIAAGEREVVALEVQIAELEADNAEKVAEADRWVASIAARERALRDEHDRNLLLCAIIPDPETCLFASVLVNDRELREYRAQLEAAQAEQAQIHRDLAAYEARRSDLRGRIDEVRATKEELLALLNTAPSSVVPLELRAVPSAAAAYRTATAVPSALTETIALEVALLTELRDHAAALGAVLDGAIVNLRALDESVATLVEGSRQRFMDAFVELVTGDPAALAEDLLQDEIAARTRALLANVDWPARELVEHLLGTRGEGEMDPAELESELLRALGAQAEGMETFRFECNGTPDPLDYSRFIGFGHGSRWTDVSMPRLRITRARVHVRLRHPDISDVALSMRGLETADSERVTFVTHGQGAGADLDQWFLLAPLEGRIADPYSLLSLSVVDQQSPENSASGAALLSCTFELTGYPVD